MKKITLKIFMIMFLLGTYISVSQTLNQNAAWPNAAWTVTGTYNAAATAFEADPTITANFAFDDDDAGNGNDDDIAAESPVIDLTAASGAGETWITISGDYVYNINSGDILQFEYWDADAGTWNLIGAAFPADTAGAPTDNFCAAVAEAYTTTVLNIAAFTPTQLSGFRYRIYYDDTVGGAGWEWGFCFQSPTIVSATPPTCPDPSTLTATSIDGFSADLGWTETGSAVLWNIELVDITAAGVVTGTATSTGVANPFNQTGLVTSNNYEFYVQADCGPDGTSAWVGPFAFSTTVACPDPSALTVTNILTTSADLEWTAGGSETLWDIELVDITAGGVQTMTATATGVANPYNQTGLVAANDYEFYVRADCAANGTSTWVGPFAFTAACIAIPAPYTEDFETFATAGTAFVGDNCWTGTGGSYYWESAPGTDAGSGGTGPDPTITTGNYFYTEASGGTAGNTTDLVSPLVDLTALTAPALTFNYHMFGGQIGTLDVLVNGTANVFTITGQQQASATAAWELAVIDLSAYAGQTISITFRGTSVGIFEGDISIDNIAFTELPSCAAPNALTATSIGGFSADLGWTENGTATTWNIELVDITGGGVATGTATNSGVTNSFNQTGLEPSNDYEYYVQADCGVDGTSAWVGPLTFSTTVACPDPSALTVTNILTTSADLGWTAGGSETLWDIELVDITAAGVATGTATATGVTNPYNQTGLVAANDYEFYVRADCAANGISTWVGPFAFTAACVAIPAPYTEDFETFATAGTAFVGDNCWTGTGGPYYWESAPGTDAGSAGTGPDPTITTGNYFYTEATGGTAGDTTDLVSPLVDLTALTAPSLLFNYHMFGGDMGTLDVLVNGTTNVFTITGQQQIAATTPWELAVIDLSAYAGQTISITFRGTSVGIFEGDISIDNVVFDELPACPLPNVLTATTITDTTADLGWTENGAATAWDVELVDITAAGVATGTPTAVGVANPYATMGLTQNNDYAFYVRSDCGGGASSPWAGPFDFSTLETCPAPSGLTATNVMETTADLGWTENATATSWNIELVDVTAGGMQTMTATATGVANPYGATGLVGDNSYEFYVQSDCGVDGVSAWTGPFAFATPYTAVPPTCASATFLDSGGASGDYSSGENITYTICPDNAGDVVTVDFTAFSTENNGAAACYDGLTIHDGADATATTIDPPGGGTIWCWDRDDAVPGGTGDLQGQMITSSDASGCLTLVFTSDGSVTREGWQAMITCAPLSTVSFESGRAFTFYPNPVDNTLTLLAAKTIEAVNVYNILGTKVLSTTPNALTSDVDTSSLQTGTYFVQVTVDGFTDTIKIIKK